MIYLHGCTLRFQVKDQHPFELECRVIGNPEPKITWYLDGEVVAAEADIKILRQGEPSCSYTQHAVAGMHS